MPGVFHRLQYAQQVQRRSPKSPLGRDMCRAFFVGGLICCVGQLVHALFAQWGLSDTDAGTATAIVMVLAGAALTAIGVYDRLASYAGGGTLVPITGFANAVASPALEFRTEGFVTGTAVRMFTIAGPVLVFGVLASVLYGLILLV